MTEPHHKPSDMPQPSRHAAKQQLYRERLKQGRFCITVEITGDDMDTFNDAGFCGWNEARRDVLAGEMRKVIEDWKRLQKIAKRDHD